MNFNDFIQQVLFNIGDHDVTARQLISWGIILIVTFLIYQLVINKVLPKYFAQEKYVIRDNSRILKSIRNIFVLIAMIGTVWVLEVDLLLYQMKNVGVRVSTVLYALTIWQVAGLLDWFASKVLVYNYHRSRNDLDYQTSVEKYAKETNSNAGNLVRLLVYAAAVFLVLQSFNLESYTVINSTNPIKVSDILEAILIILAARLVFWMVTQLFLYRYYKRSKIDTGSQYAINQLLKYVIYTMAILWAISSLGIKVTVLLGGAAALLVGIGLGLQQTFNDFFSGIVLLFERSVEIGHVLNIGGMIGTVQKIGLRTSLIETRESITVVVPNSKLVTDNVINWSHLDKKVKFIISVGVAYGSDTKLVKNILLKVAEEHPEVVEHPNPFVRFTNFGNSSLDFELHFFSRNFMRIEDVKSDLRFEIDNNFRENDVEIPFPQRVVWMKGDQEPKRGNFS